MKHNISNNIVYILAIKSKQKNSMSIIHPNVGKNREYGMFCSNVGVLKYILLDIAIEMRKSMVLVLNIKSERSKVNNVADFFLLNNTFYWNNFLIPKRKKTFSTKNVHCPSYPFYLILTCKCFKCHIKSENCFHHLKWINSKVIQTSSQWKSLVQFTDRKVSKVKRAIPKPW